MDKLLRDFVTAAFVVCCKNRSEVRKTRLGFVAREREALDVASNLIKH